MPSGAAISSAPSDVTRVPKIIAPAPNWVKSFQFECTRKPRPKWEIAGLALSKMSKMISPIRAMIAIDAPAVKPRSARSP